MMMPVEPDIANSARRHGVADEDMLHAYRHAAEGFDAGEGLTILIGGDRAGRLLEIGVTPDGRIVHAMPARPKFLR